eukprot:3114816-Rhodomonas_salina.5
MTSVILPPLLQPGREITSEITSLMSADSIASAAHFQSASITQSTYVEVLGRSPSSPRSAGRNGCELSEASAHTRTLVPALQRLTPERTVRRTFLSEAPWARSTSMNRRNIVFLDQSSWSVTVNARFPRLRVTTPVLSSSTTSSTSSDTATVKAFWFTVAGTSNATPCWHCTFLLPASWTSHGEPHSVTLTMSSSALNPSPSTSIANPPPKLPSTGATACTARRCVKVTGGVLGSAAPTPTTLSLTGWVAAVLLPTLHVSEAAAQVWISHATPPIQTSLALQTELSKLEPASVTMLSAPPSVGSTLVIVGELPELYS